MLRSFRPGRIGVVSPFARPSTPGHRECQNGRLRQVHRRCSTSSPSTRVRPVQLSGLSVLHHTYSLHGVFVRARRALNSHVRCLSLGQTSARRGTSGSPASCAPAHPSPPSRPSSRACCHTAPSSCAWAVSSEPRSGRARGD